MDLESFILLPRFDAVGVDCFFYNRAFVYLMDSEKTSERPISMNLDFFVWSVCEQPMNRNAFRKKGWLVGLLWGIVVLSLTGPSLAQLNQRTEIAFEQIDELFPYEDWLLPFVSVHEFKQMDLITGDKTATPFFGFLKSESDAHFTIIGPDLRLRIFDKSTQTFASVDFAEYSKQVLASNDQHHHRDDGSKVERWVQLLVFARAAYQRNELESCDRLRTMAVVHHPKVKLDIESKAAFARAEFRDILLLLGDLKVTRPKILARVQRYLNAFPNSQYSQPATVLEDDLLVMVDQAAMHETVENISSLPVNKQIDEWIFQLRDQNGGPSIAPGVWDIFWNDSLQPPDGTGKETNNGHTLSPAMQLVKIGNNAVPKLIERIGDSMPIRSTPFQRGLHFSDNFLTVGQCAENILSKIAGQRFGDGQSSDLAREQAKAWLEEISLKGEKQYLIERVDSGGNVAVESSGVLVAKFPEVAFDCIAKVIDQSKDSGVQTKLLAMIGQLPFTEKTAAYVIQQLKNARELETRIMAARLILPRDRDAAIKALINEFHEMVTNDVGGHWPSEEVALIVFLSNSESVLAIQALQNAYVSRNVPERTSIILSFLDRPLNAGADLQLSAQIEELLVHALSDTDQRLGYTLSRNEVVFKNPRNSELAGYVLQNILPTEYKFDFPSPAPEVEKQRMDAIKYWRRKSQLPEIQSGQKP